MATPQENPDALDQHHVETSPNGRYIRYSAILGKGAYKTVYKAFDTEEALEVAWNKLHVDRLSEHDLEKVSNEVSLLRQVEHKNIIHFYDTWRGQDANGTGTINFITEQMMSGTLKEYLKKAKAIKLKVIRRWCRNILEAIAYLHSRTPPIMHRDLKCDNIFINGHVGEVKIGDLGLSGVKERDKAESVIGTPEFMAPELYEESYTEKVDIYAFGMCLLEIVTMEYPYSECNNMAQIFKKVFNGEKPRAFSMLVDGDVKDVIAACLQREARRPSAAELLQHPLFNEWEKDDGKTSNLSLVKGSPEIVESTLGTPQSSNLMPIGTELIDWSDPLNRSVLVSMIESGDGTREGEEQQVSVVAAQDNGDFYIGLEIPIRDAIKRVEFTFDPFEDNSQHIAQEMVSEFALSPEQLGVIRAEIDRQVDQAKQQRETASRNATPQPPSRESHSEENIPMEHGVSTTASQPSIPSVSQPASEPINYVQQLLPATSQPVPTIPPSSSAVQDVETHLQPVESSSLPHHSVGVVPTDSEPLTLPPSLSDVPHTVAPESRAEHSVAHVGEPQGPLLQVMQETSQPPTVSIPALQHEVVDPVTLIDNPEIPPAVPSDKMLEHGTVASTSQEVPATGPLILSEATLLVSESAVPVSNSLPRDAYGVADSGQEGFQVQELQGSNDHTASIHHEEHLPHHVVGSVVNASHQLSSTNPSAAPPNLVPPPSQTASPSNLELPSSNLPHSVPKSQPTTIQEASSVVSESPHVSVSTSHTPIAAETTPNVPVDASSSSINMTSDCEVQPAASEVLPSPIDVSAVAEIMPDASASTFSDSRREGIESDSLTSTGLAKVTFDMGDFNNVPGTSDPAVTEVHETGTSLAIDENALPEVLEAVPVGSEQEPHAFRDHTGDADGERRNNYHRTISNMEIRIPTHGGHVPHSASDGQLRAKRVIDTSAVPIKAPSTPMTPDNSAHVGFEDRAVGSSVQMAPKSQDNEVLSTRTNELLSHGSMAPHQGSLTQTTSSTARSRPPSASIPAIVVVSNEPDEKSMPDRRNRRSNEGSSSATDGSVDSTRNVFGGANSGEKGESGSISKLRSPQGRPPGSEGKSLGRVSPEQAQSPSNVHGRGGSWRSVQSVESSASGTGKARKTDDGADGKNEKRDKYVKKGLKLMDSCAHGRYEDVKNALLNGASPTFRDYDRRTPLHLAAGEGHSKVCALLIENGAEVSAKDRWGNTPFSDACENNRTEALELLKRHGGDDGDIDLLHLHLLQNCADGDVDAVRLGITSGAKAWYADYDKRTPLHLACSEGHVEIAEVLLVNGASPEAVDRKNRTPVDDAVSNGRRDVLRLLRRYGAKIPRHLFETAGEHGHHLGVELIEESAKGNVEEVKHCLDYGADPNFKHYDHRTALHLACAEGRLDVVKVLVDAGADVDALDRWGATPLEDALKGRWSEIADRLLEVRARRHEQEQVGEKVDGESYLNGNREQPNDPLVFQQLPAGIAIAGINFSADDFVAKYPSGVEHGSGLDRGERTSANMTQSGAPVDINIEREEVPRDGHGWSIEDITLGPIGVNLGGGVASVGNLPVGQAAFNSNLRNSNSTCNGVEAAVSGEGCHGGQGASSGAVNMESMSSPRQVVRGNLHKYASDAPVNNDGVDVNADIRMLVEDLVDAAVSR